MGAVDTPQRDSGKKKGKLGARRKAKRVGIRIDMTPMVDIAFLLLIFFMVTTVFRTPKAMEINLPPDQESKVEVAESKVIQMRVLADGRLYWKQGANPFTRAEFSGITDVLAPYAGREEMIIVVAIDREAPFEYMVRSLDELHSAKLTRFSVNPMKPEEKAEVEGL
jgi:biopolymer transport protein ExbD